MCVENSYLTFELIWESLFFFFIQALMVNWAVKNRKKQHSVQRNMRVIYLCGWFYDKKKICTNFSLWTLNIEHWTQNLAQLLQFNVTAFQFPEFSGRSLVFDPKVQSKSQYENFQNPDDFGLWAGIHSIVRSQFGISKRFYHRTIT